MKKIKDNFSSRSALYQKFRPAYPDELIDHICEYVPQRHQAWDCASGSGQMTIPLAKRFKHVIATDISTEQLKNAPALPNVIYRTERAESSSLKSASIDLITVAQAIHWFDFEVFYREARRVLKKDGVIFIVGYPLLATGNFELNELILDFYHNVVGKYWDPERKYIDERYTTIPFPFEELELPRFEMNYHWTSQQMLGYLESWSAVGHFYREHGNNPIELIRKNLENILANETTVKVTFEMIGRFGKNSEGF